MKKVRFETPDKFNRMTDNECHSPRPFMDRHVQANAPNIHEYPKLLTYNSDPVQRFECSNSSPYPITNKTSLPPFEKKSPWLPSNDLELSMLDTSHHEPRKPMFSRPITKVANNRNIFSNEQTHFHQNSHPQVLSSIDNKLDTPPNVLNKDNDNFFLRRDNIPNLDINPIQHFKMLSLDKENNPIAKKAEMMKCTLNMISPEVFYSHMQPTISDSPVPNNDCQCHHCAKPLKNIFCDPNMKQEYVPTQMISNIHGVSCNQYHCVTPPKQSSCSHCNHHMQPTSKPFDCNSMQESKPIPKNAVDKKTWAIERYEDSKKSDCMEVEKQTNVSKEKREPTVSDLFKIIKLQNEQLQLLQEKVDKFISAASMKEQVQPPQDYRNHVIQTVNNGQMSIGVMTSFEMVRTSTIINKEVVKTNENAQIQCNRSQISIKEVVSKTQPVNLNFLEGIKRISQDVPVENVNPSQMEIMYDDKTLNEQSLYNVQVDNATTPMMSPEQSLYLDVRDYSGSESGSDDTSNVGWTYYNKVMTHVNGVLENSDMPSSASALYRNTQQQCLQQQKQLDKSNISVAKRVKFGDDPLGIHQPHIYTAPTDTSLKMNQLAAKYLKNGPPTAIFHPTTPKPSSAPIDMSFATRNYMERHKLLQGGQQYSRSPPPGELPRFLDITALKKQPKLL